ncbi:hypothetical protein [Lacipirellula parvula]|uniref:Uncharacterized protein n=1 Tax=Lacipirellula parvula TaxID=2650471 RepID=A0A5K7XBW4_9BACT|nr:hypothetical protein [Lacipirellula parvula]BBO34314.1 hypothetical protein PLANPX_3926 [Lacipirellula parvula]
MRIASKIILITGISSVIAAAASFLLSRTLLLGSGYEAFIVGFAIFLICGGILSLFLLPPGKR